MNESKLWLFRDVRRAEKEGMMGIRQRQRKRLAAMVQYARTNSPYYRELYQNLPERVEDSTLLPITNKKKLMERFDDWVTDREVKLEKARPYIENRDLFGKQFLDKYLVITTSGTTGTHGIFLVDKPTLSLVGPMFLRWLRRFIGISDIIRIIFRGGRMASVLAAGTPTATGVGISRFRSKRLKELSVHKPLPEIVEELNKFQPTILMCYATVAKLLTSEQEAGKLHIKPVLILLAAEGLEPNEYDRIRKVFNSKVLNSYAASECQFMSGNCEYDWLHVNSDWCILEPVNAEYQPVKPGEQSHTVLISNLANRAQPFLRYDLGDSILERADQCPCGSSLQAIRVKGRAADMLILQTDKGEQITIPPLLFGTSVYEIPGIEQFQVVQTASNVLQVRLRLKDNTDSYNVWEMVYTKLSGLLSEHKLSNVIISRAAELPEQSPGGKYREVIPLEKIK